MEHPPAHLKTRSAGFSLIELLIALSLVSVVMALAWIILDSTRNVAEEIQTQVESPLDPLWNQIQFEFDHLLPHPVKTDFPALRFSEETGLEMVSLIPGPEGVPLQTELHYWVNEDGLQKMIRTRFPPAAQTNLVSADMETLRIFGRSREEEIFNYPPEKETPLPPLITLELSTAEGASGMREFYLPASLKMSRTNSDTENSEN